MAKITIDTEREVTQKEYARIKGVSPSTVGMWIIRGKVKTRKIPELNNIVLIRLD